MELRETAFQSHILNIGKAFNRQWHFILQNATSDQPPHSHTSRLEARSANLGDDADTTAVSAGQRAGATWGASGIPAHWRARLHLGGEITALADSLWRAGSPG